MKFGVYLETNMEPEWRGKYLRYGALKAILKEIVALNAEKNAVAGDHNEGGRLSTTLPKNLAAMSFSFMETRPGNSGLKDEKPIASESTFFEALDGDMKTVSGFVELTLARLVKRVEELDAEVAAIVREAARTKETSTDSTHIGSSSSENGSAGTASDTERFEDPDFLQGASRAQTARAALQSVQKEFLRVEKFANVNTTACYKILKKHDKLIPATVCCRYYMERLHASPWVTRDHRCGAFPLNTFRLPDCPYETEVYYCAVFVVQMSDLFEKLRPRVYKKSAAQGNGPEGGPGAQNFVRTTRKYWVSTEDVSTVKQALAEHLPVFLMERQKPSSSGGGDGGSPTAGFGPGVAADSQMTSSVYLDNVTLGLYHDRLAKMPHAIAVRLRWYGLDPNAGVVFVERKTHRESWTGDESVKERFTLPPTLVVPFLQGTHTWEMEEARLYEEHAHAQRLKQKTGSPGKDTTEFSKPPNFESTKKLFVEVQRAVESKQLQPTLRTVYMRTAFQVPYDASVRCSLDTSLCMLGENPKGHPTCVSSNRWFRDPKIPVHRTDVTRFPHAVLEVKLALDDGDAAPAWVDHLIESGCLTEVHKFSKFMHGAAVLFPDLTQEVPYWIDDVSLWQSLQSVASRETGAVTEALPRGKDTSRRGEYPEVAGEKIKDKWGVPGVAAHKKPNDDLHGDLTHPLLVGGASEGHAVLDLIGDTRQTARGRDGRYDSAGDLAGSGGGGDGLSGFGGFGVKKRLSAGARFLKRKFGLRGVFWDDSSGGTRPQPNRTVPMRIEPKTYFANERTFLAWLHTAVLIGTIGAGLVSVHMGGGGNRNARDANGGSSLGVHHSYARNDPHVLTVVHRHEYVMRGFNSHESSGDAFGTSAGYPETAGGASPEVIARIVDAAIAGYFQSVGTGAGRVTDDSSGDINSSNGTASSDNDDSSSPQYSLGSNDLARQSSGQYTAAGLTIALTMLSTSVMLCIYATYTFIWRGRQISKRSSKPFHDPYGPVVMGVVMIGVMSVFIGMCVVDFGSV